MHRLLSIIVIVCLTEVAASAQSTQYLFIGPGGISSTGTERVYQAGGGFDVSLNDHVGIGAELSALLPGQHVHEDTRGLVSFNAFVPLRRQAKTMPFGTAGYSLLFRDFTANFFNFGAGIDYWYADNRAVRIEGRDHVGSPAGAPTTHYWTIRLGLAFR
jgi:hypothetical protein